MRALAQEKALEAVCYLAESTAAAGRGRGFQPRPVIGQDDPHWPDATPLRPSPSQPTSTPRSYHFGGQCVDKADLCIKGHWLLGTAQQAEQKTQSSTLNLLRILLGLPRFTGNKAGASGGGGR